MSGGEYRKLIGNIFVPGEAVKRLGLNGKIPLPLVVVHSGKTTIHLCGCCSINVPRSSIFAPLGGYSCGFDKARKIAPSNEMCCTCRVCGYDAVKIGSNIAAKYRESIGDVKEEAITSGGCGTLPSCFFASEPFLTPSICKTIHHMPGIPSIIHSSAFFTSDPRGNHCRKRKYVTEMAMKKGNLKRKRKM